MIAGTVALPVYNSKLIAWLCMESLCRQIQPVEGWELIIFEEFHSTALEESFFRDYEERLRDAGCERLHYITYGEHLALSKKWVIIANEASSTSEYFCLCAADNYYSPWMLCDAEESIKQADWCLVTRGYFYDFLLDKVIMYHYNSLIGLQMTARTSKVKEFPLEQVYKGVDGWFSQQMKYSNGSRVSLPVFIDGSEHWQGVLCTNGLNNISKNRHLYFENPVPPFYKTDKVLADIVPEDIYARMMSLRNSLLINDDLG
jgi:hypothetical protein